MSDPLPILKIRIKEYWVFFDYGEGHKPDVFFLPEFIKLMLEAITELIILTTMEENNIKSQVDCSPELINYQPPWGINTHEPALDWMIPQYWLLFEQFDRRNSLLDTFSSPRSVEITYNGLAWRFVMPGVLRLFDRALSQMATNQKLSREGVWYAN